MGVYLNPGEKLGEFEIVSQLGDGAQGQVYRARHRNSGPEVAIKVMGPKPRRGFDRERYKREVEILATLDHPGIVKCQSRGSDDAQYYLVMDLVEGISLRQFLEHLLTSPVDRFAPKEQLRPVDFTPQDQEKVRFIPVSGTTANDIREASDENDSVNPKARQVVMSEDYICWCCTTIRDIALALDYAHERDIVHRDIKPENIMVGPLGSAWLIDFGLSRFLAGVNLSDSGDIIGTSEYMSPEQLTGRINVERRSDIYSLGIVLYETLALRRPFGAPTRHEELLKAVTKPPPPLRAGNSAVSWELEAIVHRAIARDPAERYQSAAAFADDLNAHLGSKRVTAKRYRFQWDNREIRSTRPASVSIVATFYILIFLIMLISSPQALAAPAIGGDFANFLYLLFSGLVALYIGCGLFVASRTALVAMTLFNLMVIVNTTRGYLAGFPGLDPRVNYLALYFTLNGLFVTATLLMLIRPRIRAWFRTAGALRADYRATLRSVRCASATA